MDNKFLHTMESKWNGYCKNCKKGISPGQLIGKEAGSGKWVHVRCNKGKKLSEMLGGNGHAVEEGGDVLEKLDKKIFIPSVFQQAIFDWATAASGNAVVEAVAGSGKTTTIVKLLDILPAGISILFVAFGKEITKELRRRVPKNIRVTTLNALGFSFIRKLEDFQELKPDKVLEICNEFWSISKDDVPDPKQRSENRVKRAGMKKLVGLVKNTLTDFNDTDAVLNLITRYHIDIDELMEEEVIRMLPTVMKKNNRDVEYVDYDDQIYLPLVNNRLKNHFDKFDFILGDEVQDWNMANIQLVLKCLAPGGRFLGVGDRYQSLFGFRGADTQAIPHLIEWLEADTLPLSISYRCPRLHVENVQHLVPHIQAADNAIEGILGNLRYEEMLDKLEEGDMVICRTNAPLIKPAFEMIKRGKKAVIRGKNIGDELVNFIDRFQCDDLARLEVMMAEFTQSEVERWLSKNKEMMAEVVKEKHDTITAVSRECKTVEELISKIETLFSDDNVGIIFSSVHRSKGLEAKRIFVLRMDLMPHPKAKTQDEIQQEQNTLYVALTRSLEELYMVYEDDNE